MSSLKLTILSLAFALRAFSGEFLWLSDIHFNPLADPALVDKLAAAEPAQWSAILDTGTTKFPGYRQDTTWPLFTSALQAAAKTQPKPAFIMVTGDLLVHHFREQFEATAAVHDDAAFRAFVRKTTEFVALQLKSLAPRARIFVTLGNNDDVCGDYSIAPGGPFLADTSKLVSGMAGVAETNSYLHFGSYNAANPSAKHQRIIALNTVFFASKYSNRCGGTGDDPGTTELAWLEQQLSAAQKHHEKVWLVYHIPPGVDAYATIRAKQVTFLWKETYSRGFADLLQRYASVVGPNFAGHIHVNDFRLLGDHVVIGASALSPITGQNPAFRVVKFDKHGTLLDESTYLLKNFDQLGHAAPDWQLEYDFQSEWHMQGLNAHTYAQLLEQVRNSPAAAARWQSEYSTSHPEGSGITPANFAQFYCAEAGLSANDYQACLGEKR